MSRAKDAVQLLASMLSTERASGSYFETDLYSHDLTTLPKLAALNWKTKPDVVVTPRSTADVRTILAVARETKVPVVPRGAGTTMFGASVPTRGGILVDMRSMNKILSVDKDAARIEAEAGCTWLDAMRAAESVGLSIPVQPIFAPSSTLGGCLASGMMGFGALKHGSPRDWAVGSEVVLEDGTVLTPSDPLPPPQVSHLLEGSEGTLGIITKVTLRCLPAPEEIRPLAYSFPTLPDALRPMMAAVTDGPDAWHIGFLDEIHFKFEHNLEPENPERKSEVYIILEGAKESMAEREKAVDSIMTLGGGIKIPNIDAAKCWQSRFDLFRTRRISGGLVVIPSIVPANKLAEAVARTRALAAKMKINVALAGFLAGKDSILFLPYYLTDDSRLTGQMALGFVPRFYKMLVGLGGYPQGLELLNHYRTKGVAAVLVKRPMAVRMSFDQTRAASPARKIVRHTRHPAPFGKVHPALMAVRLGLNGGLRKLGRRYRYDQPKKTS